MGDSDGEGTMELELNEIIDDFDNVICGCRYPRHRLRFVETTSFHLLSASVVLLNSFLISLVEQEPQREAEFPALDHAILCFYVFELLSRMLLFRKAFLYGPRNLVIWNLLDVTVVTAGVIDQWLFPLLQVTPRGPLRRILMILRLLRLLRVLKIVRLFFAADLSWAESPKFQSFIAIVITCNSLLMGLETDIKWGGWAVIEDVLLVIYSFELAVQLKRNGLYYLSPNNPDFNWNLLDFTIVVSSVADAWVIPIIKIFFQQDAEESGHHKSGGVSLSQLMMLMRLLRLMRILRLIKLVKSVRPLYVLVTSVTAAVQGVFWVLVLTLVTIYAIAILATRLIGHGVIFSEVHPDGVEVFSTVPNSMFTLFRVMSGAESAEEAGAIDSLMKTVPSVKCAFVMFMVFSSWTLLSILTAVVSEHMISTTAEQELQMRLQSDEEDRISHHAQLSELFHAIDKNNSGVIEMGELIDFVNNRENARLVVKCIRVPTRNVVQVIKTLGSSGNVINMKTFVECMSDVGAPVTEQSVMRLEAQHADTQLMIKGLVDTVSELKRTSDQKLELLVEQVSDLNQRVTALETESDGNSHRHRPRMHAPHLSVSSPSSPMNKQHADRKRDDLSHL